MLLLVAYVLILRVFQLMQNNGRCLVREKVEFIKNICIYISRARFLSTYPVELLRIALQTL